jgi:hypothetical protein
MYHEKINVVFDKLISTMADWHDAEKVVDNAFSVYNKAGHEKHAKTNENGMYQYDAMMELCFSEYNDLWLAQSVEKDKKTAYYIAQLEKERLVAHIKVLEKCPEV